MTAGALAREKRRPVAVRPIRVLHVVGRLNRGGAETWLMQVLRQIDRGTFHLDFLVDTQLPGVFDAEAGALGSSVLLGPDPHRPWNYASSFARFLQTHGPYDIVHSHLHHFSGFVMRSAAVAGVPVRIAHSHSDTFYRDRAAHPFRRCYTRLTERWIRKYATRGIAVSEAAARSLFGDGWRSDPRISVLYCGTDVEAFDRQASSARAELCISDEAHVYAHIGRFVEPKNHQYLIEVFRCIAALDPRAVFFLAGDGPLRASIEADLERAGIAGRTRLLGFRSDVPQLLRGLVDVLLLPSLWEGLPLVTIESQAAGVPCLCSEAIPTEAIEIPLLLRRLALDLGPEHWAREAIALIGSPHGSSSANLRGTRFDIRIGVRQLEQIYLDCLRRPR